MADGIVDETKGFVEAHPYASGGIALGVLLLLVLILGGSKKSQPATVIQAPDGSGTAAAAQIGVAQIGASAANTQAQIAAGVADAATAAQLQLGVTASNNATQLAVTQANDATTIAQAQAGAATAQSGNLTLQNEFAALAASLTAFATQQNTVSTSNAGTQGSALAGVLTTQLNDATSIANNVVNQIGNVSAIKTSQGADNNPAGELQSYLPGALNALNATGGSGGTTASGSSGIGLPSADSLANLFAGASTMTSTTSALNGEQFLEGLNGLTAKIGNSVQFNAQH